jgi:AraC family transcriptional regulator
MNTDRLPEAASTVDLSPRFEQLGDLLLAGYREHYTDETRPQIPGQWQRFSYHFGKVPSQVGHVAYGVCFGSREGSGFDYLTAVEIADESKLSDNFSVARLPPRRYAVFTHGGHVSALFETLQKIHRWFPGSGLVAAGSSGDAPCFFERYSEAFNPHTGMGGMEIWVPLASATA